MSEDHEVSGFLVENELSREPSTAQERPTEGATNRQSKCQAVAVVHVDDGRHVAAYCGTKAQKCGRRHARGPRRFHHRDQLAPGAARKLAAPPCEQAILDVLATDEMLAQETHLILSPAPLPPGVNLEYSHCLTV